MKKFTRRDFVRASIMGVGGVMVAPAVISAGIEDSRFSGNVPGQFLHGVASGDPLTSAVIIWTRITPANELKSGMSIPLGWEVSLDQDFNHIIRRGKTKVSDDTDYTLKVDVVGLSADSTYYYRFKSVGGVYSPIGVTKTLPEGDVSQVKMAVFSCSNYPTGFFNVYSDAALIPDLDAVLHLGDYIYEYGAGEFATQNADAIGRSFIPGNDTEILVLADYRVRYGQYRTDKGLQSLHAAAPFICVWDDHEVTNDTYIGGAENHNEGEGDFFERKRQALQAYFEWMPIRPVVENNNEIIYRQFEFGNLVNLMMLDTRIVGRDIQLNFGDYIGATGFDAAAFTADITDPSRTLLGAEQLQWLQGAMLSSNAQWQVLGQQVLMGTMTLPAEILLGLGGGTDLLSAFADLTAIKLRVLAGDPTVTDAERARVATALPYNLDAWDGYAVEREIVLNTALAANKDLVVFAGDTHNAWANNLQTLSGQNVGVEFATSSVTSPGLEGFLQLPTVAYPDTEFALTTLIDNLQYMNVGDRGYMVVTFTKEQTEAEWVYIDNILSEEYSVLESRGRTIQVASGQRQI